LGNVGVNSPLINDGFIDVNVDEAKELVKLGAVDELIDSMYREQSELLDCGLITNKYTAEQLLEMK
jgi:DNA-binding transcriptional regulator LsrR (DeoR family)